MNERQQANQVHLITEGMDALRSVIGFVARNHGERFTELMDRVLPDWRGRRAELNRAPLADEEWM